MSLLLLFGGGGGFVPAGSGVPGPGGSTLYIEFSPTTDPLDTPVWVDITEKVRFDPGVSIRRGRSTELDSFQPGRASFVLSNQDRSFDPTHAAGDYFGNLLPLRRFRIVVEYASVSYRLFDGFCLGWPQRYDGPADVDATVPISLIDGLGLLALTDIGQSAFTFDSATLGVLDVGRLGGEGDIVVERTGARMNRVLDSAGWPTSLRDIDTGQSDVTAEFPSGGLISYLQKLERSEDGFLYAGGDGTLRFLERNARQTVARISTSQATFDDDGTDLSYSDISYDWDADNIYNDVRLTGAGDVERSAEDSTSIGQFFRRTYSDTILTTPDAVVADLAVLRLSRYKDPLLRCPEIQVRPLHAPTSLFPGVLARELLDRVTVRRTPQDVGSVIATEQLVEGISHQFNTTDWTTSLQLSPGFITAFFTLDSATLGVLDEDQLGA